ncbi:MAG: hypothetical protein IH946_04160, partial [Bacteroidetes bacterium]|nr:hypothetical protein [Bacteroidota bacterium]
MLRILLAIIFMFGSLTGIAQKKLLTPFEKSNGTETATYHEVIDYYKKLDEIYPPIKMLEYGSTDAGIPLHLVVVSLDMIFDAKTAADQNKAVILIMNGIHPGEPEGIDASMMLVRDLMKKEDLKKSLNNIILLFMPVYNIGGALNRNSHSRANQNGPKEYGFRGNARNLDLNRDFIKCDA